MNELEKRLVENAKRAVKVFGTLKRRLNALGFETPKCHDPKRRGGILVIEISNKSEISDYQIDKIIESLDPIFASKKDKYTDYAAAKVFSMIDSGLNLSELSEFKLSFRDKSGKNITIKIKIAGGVRFYVSKSGFIHMGFSGKESREDQAIVCLSAYKSEITGKAYIQELYEQTKNPFLEWNLFGALLSEM